MAKATIIQDTEAEAAYVVAEKVADLRTDQKSFSVISMEMSRIIQPISALKKENTRTNRRRKGKNGQPHCVVRTLGTTLPTSTTAIQPNLSTHACFFL